MDATFNKELFMELANLIKDDMAIYVNTRSEMARFTREHPEQYQLLLKKAQVGLEQSINDSSFELLSDKKMESLQGTGNRLESKTVVCMIVGLKIDW